MALGAHLHATWDRLALAPSLNMPLSEKHIQYFGAHIQFFWDDTWDFKMVPTSIKVTHATLLLELRIQFVSNSFLDYYKVLVNDLITVARHLRATSHTRLRARDQHTLSTLIGGKGGAGPSSLLHTTLDGPTEWVCGCEMGVNPTWILTWHRMDHASWSFGLFSKKPPLGGRANTKSGDHDTPNTHSYWFVLVYHVWGPAWIKIHWNNIWLRAQSHMTSHYTWVFVITPTWHLKVPWYNLYTLSFALSQFHGHGSWLVCEVAFTLWSCNC